MEKANVINSLSLFVSMKKSNLLNNKIINFNTTFSVTDLSKINDYKVILPKEIYGDVIVYSFKKQIEMLKDSVNNNESIRIWTSHYEIESYILLLYLCDFLKDKQGNLYVVYSDLYDKECYSPVCMNEKELESLALLEHKITKEEQDKYSKIWQNIIKNKSDMRILENEKVKLVSYDYYNDIILDKLAKLGEITICKFTALFMSEYYFSDLIIVYFIKRLIEKNKIKIVKESKENFFQNTIAIN